MGKKSLRIMIIFLIILTINSCKQDQLTRTFYMAAAPYQLKVDQFTVSDEFNFEGFDGNVDMVSLHTDNFFGIPWDEFKPNGIRNNAWHQKMEYLKQHLQSLNVKIYLSVTPLSGLRTTIAARALDVNGELKTEHEWFSGCYHFENSPQAEEIRTAYLNYVSWMVDFFKPIFLTHGIEINMYQNNCPENYSSLISLLNQVYDREKARNPELIIFPTFTVQDLWDYGERGECEVGDRSCLIQNLDDQKAVKRDRFGISAYPAFLQWEWEKIPDDYFTAFSELTNETIVFGETGKGSYNVVIPYPELDDPCITVLNSSDQDQIDYMTLIFETAQNQNSDLVVWWSLRDFLGEEILTSCPCQAPGLWCIAYQEIFKIGLLPAWLMWGSMGVLDYNSNQKTSYQTWKDWLDREKI